MGIALNTAVSGLASAQTRFASAAERVAAPVANGASEPKSQAPERPSRIRPPVGVNDADFTRDVVDLKQAEIDYKVAAKVLSAISDTEKNLLDILS